ncbi:MAG: HAD-IB family phosphatase [Thermoplasmata archaeon]|jgi:phosphoserine phosphatase
MERDKVIFFDMDGVLTDCRSGWYFIHKFYKVDNSKNIELFNSGKIDYEKFVELDISLWIEKDKNLNRKKLEKIYENIPTMKNAEYTIKKLKENGYITVIITGSPDILASLILKKLGMDYQISNVIDEKNGRLTGRGILNLNPYRKDIAMLSFIYSQNIKFKKIVSVGDGIVDIPMFVNSDISIAFNPFTEKIVDFADFTIYEKDLAKLLNILI